MAAIAHLQQGIAARNLVGVEAMAAREYIKRQQDAPAAAPTTAPVSSEVDNAGAVSTLLSAYLSANPSLHSANADIISLISSFALAQEAYNSALERGETPPPPVLAIPANTGSATLTAVPTNTAVSGTVTGTGRSTNITNRTSSSAAQSSTPGASPTGSASKQFGAGKIMVVALCGVLAALAVAA